MKVLGLMGSPRKNGNTFTFLNRALEGARETGADTDIIFVNDLNIRGCQRCNAHFQTGQCILKDDMRQVYEKINKSDVIIFASPNYLGQMTGQLKIVYDRLYAYTGKDDKITLYNPKDKKAGLIMPQRQPDTSAYSNYVKIVMYYLNLYFAGRSKILIGSGLRDAGDAARNTGFMESAYNFGKELAQS